MNSDYYTHLDFVALFRVLIYTAKLHNHCQHPGKYDY